MKTYPLYLNGQFVRTQKTIRVLNPSTTEVFAEICTVDRAAGLLPKPLGGAGAPPMLLLPPIKPTRPRSTFLSSVLPGKKTRPPPLRARVPGVYVVLRARPSAR